MRIIEEEPQFSFDWELAPLFVVPSFFVFVSYLAYKNFSWPVAQSKKGE